MWQIYFNEEDYFIDAGDFIVNDDINEPLELFRKEKRISNSTHSL